MTAAAAQARPARDIIHRCDDLTVVVFDCGTDVVFATFNEMGLSAEGDRYWGSRLFEGMGVSAVGFVSARPNWYPLPAMLAAIERVKARFAGRRMITYGFSQGGYGALKFARQLGASLSLAFSPQWSIDPADVGAEDPRFTAYYDPRRRNGERIAQYDLGERSFVLFDRRMRQDAFNADRLAGLDGVCPIPIAFAGHSTVNIVSEGGIAKTLIGLCMARADVSARDIRALLRTARPRSATYAQTCVAQLEASVARHPGFVRSALARLPEGPIRAMGFIRVYLSTDAQAQAAAMLDTLPDEALAEFDLLVLWAKFRAAGFKPGEARLAPLFARKHSTNVFARLHGVNSFIALRQTEQALAELADLSQLRGAAVHAGHFIEFYQRLGQPEEAARMARLFGGLQDIDRADRIRIGAGLLQLYKKHAMRGAMFNELVAQARAAAGDEARLLELIELALDIGSLSLVEHVIRENPLLHQTHSVVSVYAAQCEAARDAFKGATMLGALFASADRSHGFWWGLSIAAERLLGLDRAIVAAVKALRFADGAQVAKAHGRLAHLYTFAQRRRAAIGHMQRIARMRPAPVGMFGGLALLALENGKAGLAADLATVCLRAAPADVSVVLQCCRALVGAGAAAQAVGPVAALVSRAEQGLALTRAQFDDLLRCCQTVDFGLEQRLAAVGARVYPDDQALVRLAAQKRGAFAELFQVKNWVDRAGPPRPPVFI